MIHDNTNKVRYVLVNHTYIQVAIHFATNNRTLNETEIEKDNC
jgi:hypothetical protein